MPQAQTLWSLQSACCFIPSLCTPRNPGAAGYCCPGGALVGLSHSGMRNADRVSGLAGGQDPKVGVAGKGASLIQMHQERKLHRADPSDHHSAPNLCHV